MARVDQQRRDRRGNERSAPGEQLHAHVLQRARVDEKAHGKGPAHAVALRAQQNAKADAQHHVSGHYRQRVGKGLPPGVS